MMVDLIGKTRTAWRHHISNLTSVNLQLLNDFLTIIDIFTLRPCRWLWKSVTQQAQRRLYLEHFLIFVNVAHGLKTDAHALILSIVVSKDNGMSEINHGLPYVQIVITGPCMQIADEDLITHPIGKVVQFVTEVEG